MGKRYAEWPSCSAIKVDDAGNVSYGGQPIGRVWKIPGKTWNDGKSFMWTNTIGGFAYEQSVSAFELATKYVRGEWNP